VPSTERGDRHLQREGGPDHAQADALLARGEEEGDREDRDDADEVDRDGRHAGLSLKERGVSPFAPLSSNAVRGDTSQGGTS
jgi:hypothetical protein